MNLLILNLKRLLMEAAGGDRPRWRSVGTTALTLCRMNEYYAVIFSSKLSKNSEGYLDAAKRMEKLVQKQEGYLGMESVRGENGFGITISYWKDEESILTWKNNFEHREIQKLGREKWYSEYSLRISKVIREYHK